jgi:starch-binding outer membrane protein SusE/F
MKRKTLYRILAVLFTLTVIFASCIKEEDVRLVPTLETTQTTNITSSSATVVGFVVAEGDGFTEKGVCFNTATAPTITNNKVVYSGEMITATFNVPLTGLTYATKYYARAYATGPAGTIYGEELTFTTLPVVPTLTTAAITAITSFTATGGGNVTVSGGATITARGVCYSTSHNPTLTNSKTSNGTGTGAFTSLLTSLKNGTTYYVRAYATNSAGTGYGPEVSFTTVAFPESIFALGDGTTAGWDNSAAIKIDQSANPGVYVAVLDLSAGKMLKFIQNLGSWQPQWGQAAGAAAGTLGVNPGGGSDPDAIIVPVPSGKYKVTVDLGNMTYNVELFFPPSIYALGDGTTAGWDNNAAIKIDQSSTPGIYIGVLDLLAAKSLKFIQNLGSWQPQWGQASGAAVGTLGVNPGGGSDPDAITTPATAGKYKVTIDMGTMTYKVESALPTALFMIGDGVGDWSWDNTNLPMIPVYGHPNLFWEIVWMNASGGFKFAPQKAWVNDFGKTGDATGGIYDKGGDNIAVPGTAGYYMVVVDLNANKIAIADPKVYLIGNTIGSWDSGQAGGLFTVDNANSLITITKTLADGDLRMYAWHPWFTDWWQSEFIILSDKIEFRGTGGDQTRVPVTAGSHTINLNFKTGAAAVL